MEEKPYQSPEDADKAGRTHQRNWPLLIGIVVLIPSLYGLWQALFLGGIIVRGKGFPYPLIDPSERNEQILFGLCVLTGAFLTIRGVVRAIRTTYQKPSP